MLIKELIENLQPIKIIGDTGKSISSIQYDSRLCTDGSLFVALSGTQTDGHLFIPQVIEKGATAIVCEKEPENSLLKHDLTFIIVKNSRAALARLAHAWYGFPSKDLKIYAVTGTNGKTTTTFLLDSIFKAAGKKSAIIGTTGIFIDGKKIPATHTTPESLELAGYLSEILKAGCTHVAIEVSSHALQQHRADCLHITAAGFTNLTHDHLDYHKTMQGYAAAKKILFDMLDEDSGAIAMDHSEYSSYMLQAKGTKRNYFCGRKKSSAIRIIDENLLPDSSSFELDINENIPGLSATKLYIKTHLSSRFNIENAALAASMTLFTGFSDNEIQSGLLTTAGAPGRMQRISLKNGAIAFVDYAHTPDALEKALQACREIMKEQGNKSAKLICLFGCGGDRDRTKRPEMGEIAARLSDLVVITDDNPRTEDPASIIQEISNGVQKEHSHKVIMKPNRTLALVLAIEKSIAGDIILVAGKGHEDYQVIGKTKYHHDDVEILRNYA